MPHDMLGPELDISGNEFPRLGVLVQCPQGRIQKTRMYEEDLTCAPRADQAQWFREAKTEFTGRSASHVAIGLTL